MYQAWKDSFLKGIKSFWIILVHVSLFVPDLKHLYYMYLYIYLIYFLSQEMLWYEDISKKFKIHIKNQIYINNCSILFEVYYR